MATPEIEFGTPGWNELDADVDHIRLTLRTKPPTGASLQITMYEARSSDNADDPWVEVETSIIDNLADTEPSPQYLTAVRPGMDYCFSMVGRAHLLMPGFDTLSVAITLSAPNGWENNLGGKKELTANRALLNGLIYVRVRAPQLRQEV